MEVTMSTDTTTDDIDIEASLQAIEEFAAGRLASARESYPGEVSGLIGGDFHTPEIAGAIPRLIEETRILHGWSTEQLRAHHLATGTEPPPAGWFELSDADAARLAR